MKRTFVLITEGGREITLAEKHYMTLDQARLGFRKVAREKFGASCRWRQDESIFGGYYVAENGDVIVMR